MERQGRGDVSAQRGGILVNIGDGAGLVQIDMSRPSIGCWPEHAVRQCAIFLNRRRRVLYTRSGVLKGEAPRYRPIRWSEFREGRARGDYADYGHEIQISDYRTR